MSTYVTQLQHKMKELATRYGAPLPATALYAAVGAAAMDQVLPVWNAPVPGKRACYLSAEFLIGRVVYDNLNNLGVLDDTKRLLAQAGADPDVFTRIADDALGNGGLGRLAACFLDSGATLGYGLDGYGIRYKYGLFEQWFDQGFQREGPDDWQRFGDPWSVRRDDERERVDFGDQSVWAVPYDMPVIGWGGKTVNTLRLWQAEPVGTGFDFESFNAQRYADAYRERDAAEAIHSLLYPNDDTDAGKVLRLKQQYFFSSASVQSILRRFKAAHGAAFEKLPDFYALQLNDTHPTVAIPELLRLLVGEECLEFETAFGIAQRLFAYTNHTIMAEALEKWNGTLFAATLPGVYPYVAMINDRLARELKSRGLNAAERRQYAVLAGGQVRMAQMAIYAGHSVNGVAALHTEILKKDALREWYALYPRRFNNKTNGVTQRRWLKLCNPELSAFLDEAAGPEWVTDLDKLKAVKPLAADAAAQQRFAEIKAEKKRQLAATVKAATGTALNPASAFDIQIKRLHEYKRQLLNAFSILDIYFRVKDGELKDLPPVSFLFGAKAAPGYYRAKGIIKYINEIAKLINADPAVNNLIKVVFVPNYNVSWAEQLIPAADISEQISTAGTEASGTGNMKLMMNGAVTLGTWDGANIEIVQQAGAENNYVFGARVEELEKLAPTYDPAALYRQSPRLKRVVDTLADGTFDDGGTGMFAELYRALLKGASWHKPDHYYLLLDFEPYVEAKLRALADTKNTAAFAKKCLANIGGAGNFSSDRTIRQYATEIWGL